MARLLLVAIASAAALAGCGDPKSLPFAPGGEPPDPSATFTRVQGEVFSPSCALSGCHAGAAAQAGMDLTPSAAYAAVVGVASAQRPDLARVEPGDPERSYLVKKLRGDPDVVGSPMPLTGTVSDDARRLVVDWVRRGAPRD